MPLQRVDLYSGQALWEHPNTSATLSVIGFNLDGSILLTRNLTTPPDTAQICGWNATNGAHIWCTDLDFGYISGTIALDPYSGLLILPRYFTSDVEFRDTSTGKLVDQRNICSFANFSGNIAILAALAEDHLLFSCTGSPPYTRTVFILYSSASKNSTKFHALPKQYFTPLAILPASSGRPQESLVVMTEMAVANPNDPPVLSHVSLNISVRPSLQPTTVLLSFSYNLTFVNVVLGDEPVLDWAQLSADGSLLLIHLAVEPVYVLFDATLLVAIRTSDFSVQWTIQDIYNPIVGADIVCGDRLGGEFVGFDLQTGIKKWHYSLGDRDISYMGPGYATSDSVVFSTYMTATVLDAQTGKERWTVDSRRGDSYTAISFVSCPVRAGRSTFANGIGSCLN